METIAPGEKLLILSGQTKAPAAFNGVWLQC